MASAVISMRRSADGRSMLRCLSPPWLQPADQMIWFDTETENWREWFFCGPHGGVLSSVCCWLTAGIPEILRRCVIALGQEPATGVRFAFPSSTFSSLSAICLSVRHVIPQSALNYLSRCTVSWDGGCSVLLSTSCSGESSVIAEISEQNENITGFIRFRVLNREQQIIGCHVKIRRWKTHWLWVLFTHLWNCHTLLLNLSGLNAGFPWKRWCGSRTLQLLQRNV